MGAGRISRLCESGTLCPSLFAQTTYPERPYTCDAKTIIRGTEICDLLTISVRDREYSKVCGRIRAYQYGTTDGVFPHSAYSSEIIRAYLSGISITHGGGFDDLSDPSTHICGRA